MFGVIGMRPAVADVGAGCGKEAVGMLDAFGWGRAGPQQGQRNAAASRRRTPA